MIDGLETALESPPPSSLSLFRSSVLLLSALHSRRTSTYLVRGAKFTRNTQWSLIFRAHTSLFGHLAHLLRLLFVCSSATCRHRACLSLSLSSKLGCRWRSGEISPPSPLNPITYDGSVSYLVIYGYLDQEMDPVSL